MPCPPVSCATGIAPAPPSWGSTLQSVILLLLPLCQFRRSLGVRFSMAPEKPCGRELSQPVPDHVFRYVYRYELLPVVDGYRVTDELRRYRARPCPRLDGTFLTGPVELFYLACKPLIYIRALLD